MQTTTAPSEEILMFKTPSCRSCHAMMPLFHMAKQKHNMTLIDASELENHGKVLEYGIHSVPTFIRLENGIEVERHIGAMPMREFYDFIGG